MEKIPGSVNLSLDLTYLNDLSKTNNLLETQAYTIPLPFTLEQFVLVISP
jgi:hypothetical protein